jgi:hypothetical protein
MIFGCGYLRAGNRLLLGKPVSKLRKQVEGRAGASVTEREGLLKRIEELGERRGVYLVV